MSINQVFLSGNLTRDIELRNTKTGKTVGTFGIAVNDRRRNPISGEWEDYPNFFDCSIFERDAEHFAPDLTKGAKVFIQGKLHYSAWESNGQKRSKVDVTVDKIEPAQRAARQQQTQDAQPQYEQPAMYGEDIPF